MSFVRSYVRAVALFLIRWCDQSKKKPLVVDCQSHGEAERPHPVIWALELAGGTPLTNRELANMMGVTEGEASKRRKEVQHLITTTRIGKEVRSALRA